MVPILTNPLIHKLPIPESCVNFCPLSTPRTLFLPPHLCLCSSSYLVGPFSWALSHGPFTACCKALESTPVSLSKCFKGGVLLGFKARDRQPKTELPIGAHVASTRSLALIFFTYWAFSQISFKESIPKYKVLLAFSILLVNSSPESIFHIYLIVCPFPLDWKLYEVRNFVSFNCSIP